MGREEISDFTYRSAFTSYFHQHRKEAVLFIDAAIRFMNCIKKMKIEELLTFLISDHSF